MFPRAEVCKKARWPSKGGRSCPRIRSLRNSYQRTSEHTWFVAYALRDTPRRQNKISQNRCIIWMLLHLISYGWDIWQENILVTDRNEEFISELNNNIDGSGQATRTSTRVVRSSYAFRAGQSYPPHKKWCGLLFAKTCSETDRREGERFVWPAKKVIGCYWMI